MGSDMMDVKAVINQRIRMTEKIDLGRDSGRAVRMEIENATYSDGLSKDGSVYQASSWKLGKRVRRTSRIGQTT